MINYGRQFIDRGDLASVKKTLKSNWLTTGPEVGKFEKLIGKKVGVKYVSAVNSATSALHISCLALGLSKNDILWTSSNTFVSSANCGLYCGAKIDLVDINKETYNINVESLIKKLIIAKNKNKLPKILIVVHFAGQPCEMNEIFKLSKKYNFKIIEDASHALGSRYQGTNIGDCKFSDITVFSFHPVKIITTGEGGAATTKSKQLNDKLKSFRSHGIFGDQNKNKKELKKRPWMFYQEKLGYNYRLTDIQASLGISQLKKIDFFLKKRNEIANIYNKNFKNLPIVLPRQLPGTFSTYHLYVVLILRNKKNIDRDAFYKKLLNFGIKTNIHYIPVYRHPFYKKFKFNEKLFKNNESYFEKAISLPIYPSMSKKDIRKVIFNVKKILT